METGRSESSIDVRDTIESSQGKVICAYSNPPNIAQEGWLKILMERPHGRVLFTSPQDDKRPISDIDGTGVTKTKWNSVSLESYKENQQTSAAYIEARVSTVIPHSAKLELVDPPVVREGLTRLLKGVEKVYWAGTEDMKDYKPGTPESTVSDIMTIIGYGT